MFSLFSTAGPNKSVEYWEGWQAVELHRQCTFTDPKQRKEWAKGFAAGVKDMRDSKAWYKSRTMVIGVAMLVAGVCLVVYGYFTSDTSTGPFMAGAGSGVTASSIIMAAMRMISNSNISFGGGGYGQYNQYTPPPSY
jgi:hypothetical protein